ncbi:hypothetical protein BDV18DRAFT_161940 [Aspergillus unguis]
MEPQEILQSVQPLVGEVTPIRTVQETQPVEEYGDAYVAAVNVKSANKVSKVLDTAFPRDPSRPMNHLRRYARHNNLPEPLKSVLLQNDSSPQTIFALIPPPLPEADTLQKLLAPFVPTSGSPDTESSEPAGQVKLHTIKVPTLPPLNPVQAEKWANEIWPVVYNPAAARGSVLPPMQVLNRTREFIQPDAGRYLAMAQKVAEEAEQSGRGRGVGAVVVDPDIVARILDSGEDIESRWSEAIVAVAGDARYSRSEAGAPSVADRHTEGGPNPATKTYDADLEGGPDLHALMRAAELVASKRRSGDTDTENYELHLSPLESYFLSQTDLTATQLNSETQNTDTPPVPEKYQKTGHHEAQAISSSATREDVPVPRIRSRGQGGYLCTDLDVYLSHEPCVCCCMGLLLSRFRSVVFARSGRMVTGGLASEPVIGPVPVTEAAGNEDEQRNENRVTKEDRLYYGLHWRKELNWRVLGFEFIPEEGSEKHATAEDGVAFYA